MTNPDLLDSQEPETLFIRLVTGEDLIADVIWNDDHVLFINPMKIIYVLGDTPGSLKLSLIQWVFPRITNDQEFLINGDDILTCAELSIELLEYYFDTLDQNARGANIIVESYKNEDEFDDSYDESDLVEEFSDKNKKKKILLH